MIEELFRRFLERYYVKVNGCPDPVPVQMLYGHFLQSLTRAVVSDSDFKGLLEQEELFVATDAKIINLRSIKLEELEKIEAETANFKRRLGDQFKSIVKVYRSLSKQMLGNPSLVEHRDGMEAAYFGESRIHRSGDSKHANSDKVTGHINCSCPKVEDCNRAGCEKCCTCGSPRIGVT